MNKMTKIMTNITGGSSNTTRTCSSSSPSFAGSLSKAFLVAALLMGLSVGVQMIWEVRPSGGSFPLCGIAPSSSSSGSGSGSNISHRWALDHGFGFESAFEDSLYTSTSVPTEQKCQPQRLHLAQATNVGADDNRVNMTLSFTLPFQDCAKVQATVLYGRGQWQEGTTSRDAEVVQFAYDARLAVPGLADYESDWIYHVTLPDLLGGRQTYWYRILVTEQQGAAADEDEDGMSSTSNLRHSRKLLGESPVQTLLTPPVAHQPTSLALVGDLGQTENSTKTMQHIYAATQNKDLPHTIPPVSALVIAGDLSYSDGDPRRWESWLELMEPLLRSTPLYSIPGNHEIECDNTTNQVFEPYEAYFRNPNRLGPADRRPIPDDYRKTLWSCLTSSEFLGHYDFGNAFWSVDHGLAKLIGLNSYTSTVPGSPQYTWLDHELQHNVDRAVTPWLIITFHCPLHTSFRGHNGEVNSLLMLKSMEPLFVQYQVNLVVSGHDHAYLRTKPMRGSTAVDKDESGPIYLTLGAGGNREQHNKGYIHDIPEEWVAKRDISEYGFGHLHLPNATHAHLTWVRDGTTTEGIRDSVWLSNQYYHH